MPLRPSCSRWQQLDLPTCCRSFALEGSLEGKICAAVINMVIGLCIASLLSAVLSRTVVDAERSWQQP